MKYPKIDFKQLSLKDNIEIVKWAYNQDDSLKTKDKVIDYFPLIKSDNIEELVTSMYYELSNIFTESINNYQTLWNSISEYYFNEIFDYLSVDDYQETLTIYIGLLPIAPRDINNREIYINIGMKKDRFLNIITHEVLHFIWFDKFKKLYPNIQDSEFIAPHISWIYSELITPIILNRDSIVKLTLSKEECLYDFMNQEVMDNLKNIFNKNISIDERIREGYQYVKTYFENN